MSSNKSSIACSTPFTSFSPLHLGKCRRMFPDFYLSQIQGNEPHLRERLLAVKNLSLFPPIPSKRVLFHLVHNRLLIPSNNTMLGANYSLNRYQVFRCRLSFHIP